MIRSFICILVHGALKSKAADSKVEPSIRKKASDRISPQFLKLLDTQFPVENKKASIELTTPAEFDIGGDKTQTGS